jgi:hypothetical protein
MEIVIPRKTWSREDEEKLMMYVQLGLQTNEAEECNSAYISPKGIFSGSDKVRACMLGMALIGKLGEASLAYGAFNNGLLTRPMFTHESFNKLFSSLLEIDIDLVNRVNNRHMNRVTIAEMMSELRSDTFN